MKKNSMSIGGVAYKKVGQRKKNSDRLVALLDIIEDFNRLTDFDELAAAISKASKSLMNAEASSLMLLTDEKDELSIIHCTGPVKDKIKGMRIPANEGFCGWVTEHKLPLIANDIDEDHDIFWGEMSEYFITRNLICAPLLDHNNDVIGVVQAVNRYKPETINEDDIPIFQALANHAATALERGQDQKKQGSRFKEQDMYLTEIHHRVKNDLALISGIVEIESLDIENEDAKIVLKNIQSRIKSMAVVYELLSGEGSHNKAEVGTYFRKLVNGISDSLKHRNKSVDIHVNTESVVIDPYKALSCGLILNELLLNSYKHAFESRDSGLISVDLSRQGDEVIITYKDNGHGLPHNFKLEDQDSIGFKMIDALVKQLNGSLEISNGYGAQFVIRFKTKKNSDQPVKEAVLNGE